VSTRFIKRTQKITRSYGLHRSTIPHNHVYPLDIIIFGFLGSLFTITTFLLFKDARNVATSFIFSLAVSDLCSSFGTGYLWMWFSKSNWVVCNLQGSLVMFGLCASVMWGLMIGNFQFMF
jgi:hypothetical protein